MQATNDENRGKLELGMDDLSAFDIVSHQRWLMDNGAFNDMHKDQLYLYGAILNPGVKAVELSINVDEKVVKYAIFCTPKLISKHKKYIRLRHENSLIGLWQFKRMHKKEGNLNFPDIVDHFVKNYCGQKWSADVELKHFKDYKDNFSELEHEKHREDNKFFDNR